MQALEMAQADLVPSRRRAQMRSMPWVHVFISHPTVHGQTSIDGSFGGNVRHEHKHEHRNEGWQETQFVHTDHSVDLVVNPRQKFLIRKRYIGQFPWHATKDQFSNISYLIGIWLNVYLVDVVFAVHRQLLMISVMCVSASCALLTGPQSFESQYRKLERYGVFACKRF